MAGDDVTPDHFTVGTKELWQTVALTCIVAGSVVLAWIVLLTDTTGASRAGVRRSTVTLKRSNLVDACSTVLARRTLTFVDLRLAGDSCDIYSIYQQPFTIIELSLSAK